jgi:tocopherol cyclase
VTLKSPGIMGWYAYVPFMECYHGVISMMHSLEGYIDINGRRYDFNGGRGYIEKDWGRSFPKSWIWLQANYFENPSVAFMFSLAKIPWLSGQFNGFLCFLSVGGRLYRFATYTRAKIISLIHEEGRVQLILGDKDHRLEISAKANRQGHLMAPVLGNMDRHIKESVDAEIHLRLLDATGGVVYEGNGIHAGMEVQGDVESLR